MKTIVKLIIAIILFVGVVLGLSSCSSLSQIRSDEARQTSAFNKVEKAAAAKNGAIANRAEQVKYVLSQPVTPETISVADQLIDEELTLTGLPTAREAQLEQQVKDLEAGKAQNLATIAQMQKDDAAKTSALTSAKGEVVKTTAKLYSASEFFAGKADEWSGFIRNCWIVFCVAVALGVACLAYRFWKAATKATVAAAGATAAVAAKVPL